jgi:hypothetical protein
MMFSARIREPFAGPPVNPCVIVVGVIPTLSISRLRALRIDELGELRVGYRRSVDEKFSD